MLGNILKGTGDRHVTSTDQVYCRAASVRPERDRFQPAAHAEHADRIFPDAAWQRVFAAAVSAPAGATAAAGAAAAAGGGRPVGRVNGASWFFLYEAYQRIGVGLSSITYYCGPVIVLLLTPLVFRQRLSVFEAVGAVLILAGAAASEWRRGRADA